MSGRRGGSSRNDEAPSADVLALLRKQIADGIADGERLLTEPLDEGRWQGWETGLTDLIRRALGPGHWPDEFKYAQGGDNEPLTDEREAYMTGPTAGNYRLEVRDDDVRAKLGVARAALAAIDQELERRGVSAVAETDISARTFGFVKDAQIRALVERDYEELRRTSTRSTKSRAVLAGGVVEAVLMDALLAKGTSRSKIDGMRLVDLIRAAVSAQILTKRTGDAADSVRDYRNVVHPAVELRDGRLMPAESAAAVAFMRLVLEELAP